MVQLWMQWCRLCAREDPCKTHINLFFNNIKDQELFDTINHVFSVDINSFNNFPTMICTDCYNLIRTTLNLSRRVPRVTALFAELLVRSEEELDLNKIKTFHNLDFDFDVLTSENVIEFKTKDELSETTEQIVEQELMNSKTWEANPIHIKMEEDEENNYNRLLSHSDESSNESDSPGNTKEKIEQKIKKKYKSRKERWAENKNKPYCCSECHKGFMKLHNYRRHMRSTHEIIIEIKSPLFICENCGKEYKSISALKEHEHSHTEERKLKCKYCEKTFKGIPSLRLHEDTHNETNYICVVCGLQLNTQRTLRMHMLVHSDQKKHKCDFCGNEYKRAKALKNHLILHAGLRPYSCDFCEKTFANGANCRSHKKKHHTVALAAQEASGKNKISKAIIPKLRELKAVTATKANNLRENDRLSVEPMSCISSTPTVNLETQPRDLLKSVDNESLTHEKCSSKEEPDYFQKMFGPLASS